MMKIMMTMTMMMMTIMMVMLELSHYRGNQVKVEERCYKVAQDLVPTCLAPDDLVFADDLDLRSEDDDEKRDVPSC